MRRRRVLLTWWVSRRRPSWPACTLSSARASLSLPLSLPSLRTLPSLSVGRLAPYVRLARVQDILVSPLCRVTFGLYARPNLPDRRPGPPFSTNPGDELRGSRGLLVAMETEPSSPNPRLNQTPVSCPSVHTTSLLLVSRYLFASSSNRVLPPIPSPSFPFSKPVVVVLQTAVIVEQASSTAVGIITDSSDSFLLASSSFSFMVYG